MAKISSQICMCNSYFKAYFYVVGTSLKLCLNFPFGNMISGYNEIKYYVLVNLQNLILKYSSKGHSYSPPVYMGRNIIAAFTKKRGRWATYEVLKLKSYPYIEDLMRFCIENRFLDGIGMKKQVVLGANDPRRVTAVLAPIPPPTKQQTKTNYKFEVNLLTLRKKQLFTQQSMLTAALTRF